MLNILVRGHAGAEGYRGSAWVMPDMALRPWEHQLLMPRFRPKCLLRALSVALASPGGLKRESVINGSPSLLGVFA